jgi:hypothetical protein
VISQNDFFVGFTRVYALNFVSEKCCNILSCASFSFIQMSVASYDDFSYSRCSRVIWLGDLNYRLALSDEETWRYVRCRDWESLLLNDQVLNP